MRTDSTSSSSTGAELQQGAEPERRDERRWSLPTPEVAVCAGLYAFAVSAVAERWLSGAGLAFVAVWLFPLCWTALVARRARSQKELLDTRTARGRRVVERAAWRTLVPAVALSTVLLIPFGILGTATAFLNWWQQLLVYAAVGLMVGLLGRLWRTWRSRPSA